MVDQFHQFCAGCGTATDQRGPHCSQCGMSVRAGSSFKAEDALPPVREPMQRTHWVFDTTYTSALSVVKERTGVFTCQKFSGNCWRTVWGTVPLLNGIHYVEYEIMQITGGHLFLGFCEVPTAAHLTLQPNLQHYHLTIGGWSQHANHGYPWLVSTEGVNVVCRGDQRAIPGGSHWQVGLRVGFVIDFFSDKIDYYRAGTFVTTLATGIRRFTQGVLPVLSIYEAGLMVRVHTNRDKPVSAQETETIMLHQQDYLRQQRNQIEELQARLALSTRNNDLSAEANNNLRRQVQELERRLAPFRRGEAYEPSEHNEL